MAEVIRMPRMSDTMEEGVIVGWLKQVGDAIEPGDVLAEVETDKATMELESYQEGVLLYIGVKEGAVPVNGILAVIGEKGEDYKAALAAAQKGDTTTATNSASTENSPTIQEEVKASTNANGTRIKASPLAKRIAKEAGINIANISGTGDQGRIVKKDVEAYLADSSGKSIRTTISKPTSQTVVSPKAPDVLTPTIEKKEAPAVAPFLFSTDQEDYETLTVSQMRKTIARRLGESKFSAPHFYLTIEINMDKAITARKQINEIAPTRISYNDFILKACAVGLRQHPAVNSSWLGDTIRINKNINIGVAVAVEDGLLVPVIKHTDMKSLSQINMEVRELAEKAKTKKLSLPEMQGNTFTVSNLGMFDIEEFTAIINPPDACILAVGSIVEKAIVRESKLVVGNMMKVTLSCDHRVVDGATGAKFLQTVKSVLEDPIRLLV